MLTKEDLETLSKLIDDKVKGINARFDTLETRFDTLETRFDTLETRFDQFDERLSKIENVQENEILPRLSKIENVQENEILPRLQNIEECYLTTFERYKKGCDKIDTIEADVEVLKKVVYEHSEKLGMIS